MGNRRHILDLRDVQTTGGDRSDRRFATGARSLHPDFDVAHAKLVGFARSLFASKLPGADMISIGPDMSEVHTPAEQLHIGSVGKFYVFLGDLLAALV